MRRAEPASNVAFPSAPDQPIHLAALFAAPKAALIRHLAVESTRRGTHVQPDHSRRRDSAVLTTHWRNEHRDPEPI
jgi:hypothetical protein